MNVLQRYWPCFTGYRATNDAVRIPPEWRQIGGKNIHRAIRLRPLSFTIIASFKGHGLVYIKCPDTGCGIRKVVTDPPFPQMKTQQSTTYSITTRNRDNHNLHFYSLSPILQSQRNAIVLPYNKKRGLPQCGSPPSYE